MNPGAEKFNGFVPESLQFLRDLKENNSKVWFEAHSGDYEQHLLAPLRALTAGLTPLMLSIDAIWSPHRRGPSHGSGYWERLLGRCLFVH
jgi:uncharacterized protein (DUF2461 family)